MTTSEPSADTDPGTERVSRGTHFVQSIERGLAVLLAFDQSRPQMTLADVARVTGLDRAAARRFLLTFVDLGYVAMNGRFFELRPRVLEIGYAYLSSLSLPEVALPHMEALVEKSPLFESCALSVLDDHEVVFVARVPTRRFVPVAVNVGARFPAHRSSMGRILLADRDDEWLTGYLATHATPTPPDRPGGDGEALRAELERVRTRGWAVAENEFVQGVRSLAVAVRDSDGRATAAMNVSTQIEHASEDEFTALLPLLRQTAHDIESDVRHVGRVSSGTRQH